MLACGLRISTVLAAAMAACLMQGTLSHAQTVRYVSSHGNNANKCTRDAPCRTLQRAINRSPVGGEVQVLDAGNYGNAVTINKSITISAIGVAATVGAVTVDADGPVVLRGLTLQGTGLGSVPGLNIIGATSVHVVGCRIERFGSGGITIGVNDASIFVSDTIVRANSLHGLAVAIGSSGQRVTIDNTRIEFNSLSGIVISGGAQVAISRVAVSGNGVNGIGMTLGRVTVVASTIAHNGGRGFQVNNASTDLTVESSVVRGNFQQGLLVGSGVARISNSVVTNNSTGLHRTGGTLFSRGNNVVSGNATDTSGVITALGGV